MIEHKPGIYGVVGCQWGDEGKGKIIDFIAPEFDAAARFAGGPNAGHTVYYGEVKYDLHQLPSSILYPEKSIFIGNGTYLEPALLADEIEINQQKGADISECRLFVSTHAQLLTPVHRSEDQIREKTAGRQGSTQMGIAFAAADKGKRTGARADTLLNGYENLELKIADALNGLNEQRQALGLQLHNGEEEARIWMEKALTIRPYLENTQVLITELIDSGGAVLAEGAQGFWLDIEQGWWPHVTSSDTTTAGIPKGLGVPPWYVKDALGVVKAYKSRVGAGPFVTEFIEQDAELREKLRRPEGAVDTERGTTTGRDRRLGWFDAVEVRQAIKINGTNEVALTQLDALDLFNGSMKIAIAYKRGSQTFVNFPESLEETPAPDYEEVGLWHEDMTRHIRAARTFTDLAKPVRRYIEFMEEQIAADISLIGTGPARDQIIDRR